MAGCNMLTRLLSGKRGSKLPAGVDSSAVIFVPVKKIICMSTTHLAMISALDEEKTIAGVSGTDLFFTDLN